MYDRKQYLYEFLLLTVMLIWGFNFAVIKLLYEYFHPIAFNALRFTVAAGAMVFLLKWRGTSLKIDREDWPGVVWLGLLSNTFYQFLFALGLARSKAGNGALFMALTPIFAYLMGVTLRRECFSQGVLAGIILSLIGVSTIILYGSAEVSFGATWKGDLMLIGAAFCWGSYSGSATRLLVKYGALRLTVLTMIAGSAILVPLSLPWLIRQNWLLISRSAWFWFLYSALLAIVYSYFVWSYALSHIGVARTAVFSNIIPIVALIGAWLLLGEAPSAPQLAGVILVLTGVFIVRYRKPAPAVVPDE